MKTQDVEVGADQVNINMEYKAGSIQCWVKSQHRFLKEEEELFFCLLLLKVNPIQNLLCSSHVFGASSTPGNSKGNSRLEEQQELFADCCSFNNCFSFNNPNLINF
jgi:hypothetical protein